MSKKDAIKKLRRRILEYWKRAAPHVLIEEAQKLGLRIPKILVDTSTPKSGTE